MSQIFVSGLSFHFMSKNRQLHDFFFDFLFSKYYKKRTGTYIQVQKIKVHFQIYSSFSVKNTPFDPAA